MPGFFYQNYLFLCCESEEDLKVMDEHFVEVRSGGRKVNADKSKVMVKGG